MRQTVYSLLKAIMILIGVSAMVACDSDSFKNILKFESVGDPDLFQDDVNVDIDRKNVDIEVAMSEQLAVTVLQPTLLNFLNNPLYRYLDASEFPGDSTTFCQNADDNSPEVSASFVSSRTAGEAHLVGDQLNIVYENCELSSGQEVSGALTLRYTEVSGLNDTFLPVSTQYCLSRMQALNSGQYATLSVVGDEVLFKPFGRDMKVEVYEYVIDPISGSRTEQLVDTHFISKSQATLVVNERGGGLTSLDGDQVYLAYNGDQETIDCQYYLREMSVEVANLTINNGVLTTNMNGSITLSNVSKDLNLESFNIIDSDFTMGVSENSSYNEFTFDGFSFEKIEDSELDTYSIGFAGFVTSPAVGGVVEISALEGVSLFKGVAGAYPTSGFFSVHGQGLERVNMNAFTNRIEMSVDYDGDDLRGGLSVADEFFTTTWLKLLNREFVRDDYVPEE